MKSTLLIAAVMMAAAPAFASKARLNSLSNAEHVSDVQRMFDRPYEVTAHGELATFEFGPTSQSAAVHAEGGFVRQMGEGSYLGFYLGRQPAALVKTTAAIGASGVAGAADMQNTFNSTLDNGFNVLYGSKAGDMTWGANLFYLSSNVKTSNATIGGATLGAITDRKANVAGISLGATAGQWEADAVIGLMGKSEFTSANVGDVSLTSNMNLALRGAYTVDTMYYYAKYAMGGAKVDVAGTDSKLESNEITLGAINTHKKDGVDFFYGGSYVMTTEKSNDGDDKTETSQLPVVIGVEAEAASWLVFRGSITQNLLLGSTKETTATVAGDSDTIANNTTVAAGAGLKFGKFTMDGVLKAGTTGDFGLDGTNFLGQGSLTYVF